ncbi:MAG: hypothetical protein ACOYB1_11975 [Limnohabitans sp.]
MGIALLALSGLFQGLTSFHRAAPAARPRPVGRIHPVWTMRRPSCQTMAGAISTPKTTAVTPALRVLRVSENGPRSDCAGRMVISGRMADVCAELDRMVALEAAQARH